MAEIRNYTMNFSFGITCLRHMSLHCNAPRVRRIVAPLNISLRPEIRG